VHRHFIPRQSAIPKLQKYCAKVYCWGGKEEQELVEKMREENDSN
jgi:hypothetical protein